MQENNIIKKLSQFTKINENKIENYLENHDLLTLFEHPETINPTQNQLKNFKDLQKLNNLSKKLIVYDEYKFENTLNSIPFLSGEFENMYDKEHFVVAYLDRENKLLGSEKISTGTLNASIVHPRDVMKKAIQYDSDRLILAHNHPSGDPAPSNEDRNITYRLEEVAKALDKKIIDHIIIGRNDYYSFREEGDITVNYEIEKTNTLSHKNIFKKDLDNQINLLNKFTKITKTELKNILKNTSVKDFIKNPEEYISNEDSLIKINMLKELQNSYLNKANMFNLKNNRIKSPDHIENYVKSKYDNHENINVVLYLDTKNTIIESEILAENLTSKEEAKHIIEKAILHDSNSFALSTKTNASQIRYSEESIDRVSNIKQLADLVGINLIDNVAVNKLSSLSYKASHLLENKVNYKTDNKEVSNSLNTSTKDIIKDSEYKHLVSYQLAHYENVEEIGSGDTYKILYNPDKTDDKKIEAYSNYKDLWEQNFKSDFIEDFDNFTLDDIKSNKELNKVPNLLSKLASSDKDIKNIVKSSKEYHNPSKEINKPEQDKKQQRTKPKARSLNR